MERKAFDVIRGDNPHFACRFCGRPHTASEDNRFPALDFNPAPPEYVAVNWCVFMRSKCIQTPLYSMSHRTYIPLVFQNANIMTERKSDSRISTLVLVQDVRVL